VPDGTVFVDISMSLDGFIAGPNDDVDPLHEWLYGLKGFREPHGMEGGTTDPDSEVIDEAMNRSGAVIVGRRMYDLAGGWGDNPPFHKPGFVLTHRAREPLVKEGGTTFTFVTDGAASALAQARAVAGDRDISIGGGANTVQQYLDAGLVDEMQIHIVPVLLGAGIRLFEGIGPGLVKLETSRVIESPAVTHLRFRVLR
jgi:dihydrofolate reductase